jgi:hypothetical protein
MRKFLLTLGFGLLVAGTAFAGGGVVDDMPQQQMAPQGKVIVVQPAGGGWVIPVAVAAVGALGVVAAAIVTNRQRG